ncbi:Actin-related protein [Kalmanozyma brasiliensis GHG001]|uniref:Actin-related protein n=1 Tax=Kalmanozyma brasiliensis (strain GHG001) TaxID=1365824 RepID=UPI001CEB9147|nr:Actin-related protein [Kalmanozyma brasiliensis GHG001]EST07983.2 Actin-related protein [Kalmanozyma brasiliensis GHG001]
MPTSTADAFAHDTSDPLDGVDHIIVIDNGAHNIRIASIPYPFPSDLLSSTIDPTVLASTIPIDVFPNAIARTRSPHTIPSSTSPTAPPPGGKTSLFVSSHIHTLLDDYAALHLRLPHQSGVIVDWAAQKQIWDHVFANHLAKLPGATGKKGKLLQGKAVILTETYCNVEPVQYAMDLLLYEQYGAHAVWRTSAAGLVGLGTDVFRTPQPSVSEDDTHNEQDAAMEHNEPSTSKRPARAPRTATTTTSTTATIPRILPPPLPQSLLVLDLGYSYCHAIPILHGQPHLPSIRRLDLGGKMLINLLKETLSFGQLDMMDESWLTSHIFARVSFVAASVGRRSSAGLGQRKAAEWSYEDLLALEREGRGGIGVTWSLPDYGGGDKGGEERDRARYGYILDGPNPPRFDGDERRKRSVDWDSAFIATSSPTTSRRLPPSDEDEETQTLKLATERFSIMENLFNPTALSLDQQPLPLLVRDAIASFAHSGLPHARAAADMMWSNIILTGGLANCVGLKRRLEHELRSLAPEDVGVKIWTDEGDASLTAVRSGVGVACEVAAKEAVRRESSRGEDVKAGKKRGRKSRASVTVEEAEEEVGGRWLTYAQWMNAGSGSEADIVRAANAVFYPSFEG